MVLPKIHMKRKAPTQDGNALKAMKSKRVSKVAKGRFARVLVLRGRKEKTVSGLTKDGLMRNKRGRVVSKRASAAGMRRYRRVEGWIESLMEARQMLHTKGFVAVNGKSLHGKALYLKAKSIYEQRQSGASSSSAAPDGTVAA
mmetsp:Transcript_61871/g.184294  ORF Transcript_61871/g.184294 Transcript_61871/m.184294 type:complete len:143 (+) Transcript_61871:92-520(+)